MTDFVTFLKNAPFFLLPGALGTELQRRGYRTALPLWSAQANLDAFDLVTSIHKDYLAAGADACTTNTFRTTPRTFRKVGREHEAGDALKRALAAAHAARDSVTDRPVFIAGSFAPLEDCYEPDLVPSDTELAEEHGWQAQRLAAEGADFLLPETINALSEACAMAKAASETGLPFVISFVTHEDGKTLLDGTPLATAIRETALPGRVGVAVNCRPIDTMAPAFQTLTAACKDHGEGIACGVYPNGFGHPHDELGWLFEDNADSTAKFVNTALDWKTGGAKIIGGCCGTTPEYIRALGEWRKTLQTQNAAA